MTVEIAILNKSAIALAADSAVTLGGRKRTKVYNSVNKLFTLSKHHPVGIMVYGNAEFMGIPWETIIKEYRKYLGDKSFDFLRDYINHFSEFLESGFIDKKNQKIYMINAFNGFLFHLRKQIDDYVNSQLKANGKISENELKSKLKSTIEKYYQQWNKFSISPHLPDDIFQIINNKYESEIKETINNVLDKLPLLKNDILKLLAISVNLMIKDSEYSQHSGVVFAGFGEKELFPSLISILSKSVVVDKFMYIMEAEIIIDSKNSASIIPFAQTDMIATFMQGMDPKLEKLMNSFVEKLITNIPTILLDNIENLTTKEKEIQKKKLLSIAKSEAEKKLKQINEFKMNVFVNPIVDAVGALPKDELAAMAEALVSLTAFKQKISIGQETVGGPIDVAVISKGDGFVWIKRKHYFKPELNHHFFVNYYGAKNT